MLRQSVVNVYVCEVYVQVGNADIQKAVQAHLLLLKTLSRSGNIELVDAVPADVCISVAAGSDSTLHVDITVSAPVITDYCGTIRQSSVVTRAVVIHSVSIIFMGKFNYLFYASADSRWRALVGEEHYVFGSSVCLSVLPLSVRPLSINSYST